MCADACGQTQTRMHSQQQKTHTFEYCGHILCWIHGDTIAKDTLA